MLNVILTILKVIGILLLILLGILVLLLCLALFIPTRYHVVASKNDEIKAKVQMSWFLRLIYISLRYEEGSLVTVFRILGIPVYDSRRPKKEKKSKRKDKTKKSKRKKRKKIKGSKKKMNENASFASKSMKEDSKSEDLKNDESNCEKSKSDDTKIETLKRENSQDEEILIAESMDHDDESLSSDHATDGENKKITSNQTKGMKSKIKQIIDFIRNFPRKVKNFFVNLINKVKKFFMKIPHVFQYVYKIKSFIFVQENQATLKIVFETVRNLVKHSMPKRITGNLIFGFEDPCTTGQVLGALSVAYAYLNPKKFTLVPDFTESKLIGELDIRGRVYAFVMMKIGIRLLRDENFRGLKDRWNQFKEE